ncbi:amidase [Novosphingobium sp. MBES04]|nr:amidase [Novosphingobium sp. MBES04]
MLDEAIARAHALAALKLDNASPPAELFDPRLPGWQPREAGHRAAAPRPAPPRPSDSEDIAFAPLIHLSQWIQERTLTSLDLTRIYLARIEARAGRTNAIATLRSEDALREAHALDQELEKGHWRGALHGIPYGLKDLVDTAGLRTAWGAAPYRDRVPDSDATLVTRLRDAGAILLAKTTCGALAYGDRWYGGRTRNPWNLEEGSSGSSAGSAAAVADGLCGFAIGTETMGSIIAPSARCGTAGLRPTFGRTPRSGVMALCWSFDKVGVLARDPADTLPVLAAIEGADGLDPCAISAPLAPEPALEPTKTTLGYRPEWFENAPASDLAVLDAARQAGFHLQVLTMPDIDLSLLGALVSLESAAAFEELTASGGDDLLTWQDDVAWPNTWRAAHFETAVNYIQAQRLRRRLMQQMALAMDSVDAILHPNNAGGLLPIGNYCGLPGVIFPSGILQQPTRHGFTSYIAPDQVPSGSVLHNVPFGTSLTGHLFDEARLVAIARTLQSALGLGSETLRPPFDQISRHAKL